MPQLVTVYGSQALVVMVLDVVGHRFQRHQPDELRSRSNRYGCRRIVATFVDRFRREKKSVADAMPTDLGRIFAMSGDLSTPEDERTDADKVPCLILRGRIHAMFQDSTKCEDLFSLERSFQASTE